LTVFCFVLLQLADLRYAKRMDGSKSFTICGDPLYFAPEIISNQGYDYGADLWAFGVLFYELYEGMNPFGSSETEETAVFKAVTGYKSEKLVFSDKTDEAGRKLIKDILCVQTQSRLGYKASKQVKDSQFFAGENLPCQIPVCVS
jgi:serine/threonine protein kinase